MANRRMFSLDIVGSEEFLSMPISSQALYFHLGMDADDDGFVQPKITMRTVGVGDDDLKVLIAKRFILPFETGVVVIKHWLIHNIIRGDRYKPTRFQEEKEKLVIKENKAYTERNNLGLHYGNQTATQVRLSKDRINVDSGESTSSEEELHVEYNLDHEGEEIQSRWPKKKKDPNSVTTDGIVAQFDALCIKHLGTKPTGHIKAKTLAKRALEVHKLSKAQITDLFDDWFNSGKADDTVVHITQALSDHNVTNYKLKYGIK